METGYHDHSVLAFYLKQDVEPCHHPRSNILNLAADPLAEYLWGCPSIILIPVQRPLQVLPVPKSPTIHLSTPPHFRDLRILHFEIVSLILS